MNLFITQLWENPQTFFLITLVVIFSICLHEYFHARCALWMGDTTAADAGHLTLNPLRQMGIVSLIMLLVAGIAWGAVPVDPQRLRSRHSWGPLAVSLAGPAANLLLAVIAWIAVGFLPNLGIRGFAASVVMSVFFILGVYNITLMIFNLIPAPGLDGWNVLTFLVPKIRSVSSETVKGFMVFLIFGALIGVSYLFRLAGIIMNAAPNVIHNLFF